MQQVSVLGRPHRVLLGDGGLHLTAAFSLCLSRPTQSPPTTWTLCFELPWSVHLAHPPQAEVPGFLREETWFLLPILPGYSAYAACVHFPNSGPRPRTLSSSSVFHCEHTDSRLPLSCSVWCSSLDVSFFWFLLLAEALLATGGCSQTQSYLRSTCRGARYPLFWLLSSRFPLSRPLTPPHQDPGLWQPGFWSLWTPPTTGSCLGVSTLTHMYSWEHCRVAIDQFSSVAQSCLTPCNPMDCGTPGFPDHHHLLELTQTCVHWVGDAIQPSHPLLPPSPPAFNLSQHQGLFKDLFFQRVSSSHQVAKVLEFQLQHQSVKWKFRTDFL